MAVAPRTPAASAGPTTCPACLQTAPAGARFCPNCGTGFTSLEYGSFGRRLVAYLLDYVIGFAVGFVLAIIGAVIISILGLTAEEQPEPERSVEAAAFLGIWLLSAAGYHILMNAYGGTLGKRVLGMRLQHARSGENIGLGRSFVRFIVSYAGGMPLFYLGYLWSIWDRDRQTWHDKAAGSVVVRS